VAVLLSLLVFLQITKCTQAYHSHSNPNWI
jgi:hypothetical protein